MIPFFSVIIPLYNKQSSITGSIRSVISQTWQDFELLVIDDGSTDDSLAQAQSIHDPRLTIIHQENQGVSGARNFGITQAKSEFVAFLDADDLWDINFLSKMRQTMHECPDAVLWGCKCRILNSKENIVTTKNEFPPSFSNYIPNYFFANKIDPLLNASGVIIRRSILISINGFDTSLKRGEDWDLWIRCAIQGKISYLNEELVIYRWCAENRASVNKADSSTCFIWNLEKYCTYLESRPEISVLLNRLFIRYLRAALTSQSIELIDIYDIDRFIRHAIYFPINSHLPIIYSRFPQAITLPTILMSRAIATRVKPFVQSILCSLGLTPRSAK